MIIKLILLLKWTVLSSLLLISSFVNTILCARWLNDMHKSLKYMNKEGYEFIRNKE